MNNTAYITWRDNTNVDVDLLCCICNEVVGPHIYYYDRDEVHYSAVCNECIHNLKSSAEKKGFTIIKKKSDYSPNAASEVATINKIKIKSDKTCSNCNGEVKNFSFTYKRGNVYHKCMCSSCIEGVKHRARKINYKILFTYEEEPDEINYSSMTKSEPIESNNNFFVVCSKCFAHTYSYKSYSVNGIKGLCKHCAY